MEYVAAGRGQICVLDVDGLCAARRSARIHKAMRAKAYRRCLRRRECLAAEASLGTFQKDTRSQDGGCYGVDVRMPGARRRPHGIESNELGSGCSLCISCFFSTGRSTMEKSVSQTTSAKWWLHSSSLQRFVAPVTVRRRPWRENDVHFAVRS